MWRKKEIGNQQKDSRKIGRKVINSIEKNWIPYLRQKCVNFCQIFLLFSSNLPTNPVCRFAVFFWAPNCQAQHKLQLSWAELALFSLLDRTEPTRPGIVSQRKKNDSRGMKFCMHHLPAILRTTQHNFNPTIFWGGESSPPPWLTLPFLFFKKTFLDN